MSRTQENNEEQNPYYILSKVKIMWTMQTIKKKMWYYCQ